ARSLVRDRSAASEPHHARPNPVLCEPARPPRIAARQTISASLRERFGYEAPQYLPHYSGAPNRIEFDGPFRRKSPPRCVTCPPAPTLMQAFVAPHPHPSYASRNPATVQPYSPCV